MSEHFSIAGLSISREEWLAERRMGLGGSDAAPACGLSKWKTPLELWLDKRGELEPSPETEQMRWGTLLEPVVRQEYSNRTGRTVVVPQKIIRHAAVDFALVNVDGIADESRLYEGKSARTAEGWGEPGTNEIPLEYMLQCQHGMFVTGLLVTDVAVLVGGSDFRLYEVPADPELQAMLMEREAAFWAMVKSGQPPAPMSREDVKRRWRVSSGASVAADEQTETIAHALRRAKDLATALEGKIDEYTALLQTRMGEAAELTGLDSEVLATWKNTAGQRRLDIERLKAEQPGIYKSYLRDAVPQRRFLLKVKGEACPPAPLPLPQMEAAKLA